MFAGYEYFKAVLKSSLPTQNQKLSRSYIVSEFTYSAIANWSKSEYYFSTTLDSVRASHLIKSVSLATLLETYTKFTP